MSQTQLYNPEGPRVETVVQSDSWPRYLIDLALDWMNSKRDATLRQLLLMIAQSAWPSVLNVCLGGYLVNVNPTPNRKPLNFVP